MPISDAIDYEVRAWVNTYLNPCPLTPAICEAAAKETNIRPPKLAFLPGTGLQSNALARAFGAVGLPIIVGSRRLSKAQCHEESISRYMANVDVTGMKFAEAAEKGDVIFWLLPTTTVKFRSFVQCRLELIWRVLI
jgi:hypothetical protein